MFLFLVVDMELFFVERMEILWNLKSLETLNGKSYMVISSADLEVQLVQLNHYDGVLSN